MTAGLIDGSVTINTVPALPQRSPVQERLARLGFRRDGSQ
jgi:hypothetical protein